MAHNKRDKIIKIFKNLHLLAGNAYFGQISCILRFHLLVPPINCTKMPDFVTLQGPSALGERCVIDKIDKGVCMGGCGRHSEDCCQPKGGKRVKKDFDIPCGDNTTLAKSVSV